MQPRRLDHCPGWLVEAGGRHPVRPLAPRQRFDLGAGLPHGDAATTVARVA